MDLSTGVPVSIQLKTIVQQGNEQKDFFFDLEGHSLQRRIIRGYRTNPRNH